MNSAEWICCKNEISGHIKKLFAFYQEDLTYFDEYLSDVLKCDIQKSLVCFRDLVNQLNALKPQGSGHDRAKDSYPTKTKESYKLHPAFSR